MKFSMILGAAALSVAAFFSVGSASAGEPFRLCTASAGGNYEYVGNTLKKELKGQLNVEVIHTAGSWENLQKLQANECDGAIVQSDAIYLWEIEQGNLNFVNVGSLYTEFFHLLCNKKSSVQQFSDLTKNTKVFSGGRGSGADVTVRGLIKADEEYSLRNRITLNEHKWFEKISILAGAAYQAGLERGARK